MVLVLTDPGMIDGMKRILRIFGVLAGLGTAIWLLRDRFVSLALPREPEPPAFRVAPHTPPPPAEDLTVVKGIGPVYEARLHEAGVSSLRDLASRDPEDLATRLGVPAARVAKWIEEASFLSSFKGD